MQPTPYKLNYKVPKPAYDDDVLVADITVTLPPYTADASGECDCSGALQKALDDCAANGGGTVYLPRGKYIIRKGIRIPPYVTLRGDCNPDFTCADDCGTLIIADTTDADGSVAPSGTPLFSLGGSGGVKGLTVYYPKQSLREQLPYPPAFYVDGVGDGYMLQTVENVTVINGYTGIEACTRTKNAHEQFTVDGFRGTFLNKAAEVYNQADVGTWKNVDVSPHYWARFDSQVNAVDVRKYTRKNCEALTLGDLEWTEFYNLSVSGCKAAIHIVKGKRIEFAGSMFKITVRDCENGVIVDSIDERWGMCAACGTIDADVTALANNTGGIVSLTDVKCRGAVYSKGSFISSSDLDTSGLETYANRTYVKPTNNVFTADFTPVSDINDPDDAIEFAEVLQSALDFASQNGGGAVYVPAGIYNLRSPVRVPVGVELRGSSAVATREQGRTCKGTVIFVRCGVGTNEGEAAVTLCGNNAGVNGIRFIYPDNSPYINAPTTPCIRGTANGVYCVNCAVAAAEVGLEFVGCIKFYVKKLTSCCYMHSVRAINCVGGHIEGCLQNGTVIARTSLSLNNRLKERDCFPVLFDAITRVRCEYLSANGCRGLTVLNTFAYGVKSFADITDCGGVLFVNAGADNIGKDAPLMKFVRSEATGVCLMRYNGRWFDIDGESEVCIRGAIAINEGHTQR